VFRKLAKGEELCLPNLGMETVHHVHADDVAQAFMQAILNWGNAVGESFHVVSAQAVTLRGYATAMAKWFGQEPNLKYVSWKDWQKTVSPEDAQATWDHIAHSPNCSIAKARERLHYEPRYSSLQAVEEAVRWLIDYDELLYR
jgi:nucleoside-diphosphate-sugar epimerase